MVHHPLTPQVHAANRAKFAAAMGDHAIAIIDTADLLTRAGDYDYPYRPDSNFYYLTGIDEPEAILVLIPGHSSPAMREILFVSGTSDFVGTWEGDRRTPEQASQDSGIKTVLSTADFEPVMDRLVSTYQVIYTNAEASLTSVMTSPALRRATHLRAALPTHQLQSAIPQLARQRMIKHPEEIERLREAINLTGAGIAAARAAAAPGGFEYQIEAALTAEFIRQGSTNAFLPIVAAGRDATIIHHMKNNGPVAAGDLVLLDVGAEIGYYAADISRTFAVDGSFTPRQRAVYDAVLRLQQAAIALLKPGVNLRLYEEQVGELYLGELVGLGVIKPAAAKGPGALKTLRAHYPHRTSHFLGLDLHDAGDYTEPIAPGVVLTVEPGIYLREEGIGVRLEDVVLITDTGAEVLSAGLPSDLS